jgi:hypothetical protein
MTNTHPAVAGSKTRVQRTAGRLNDDPDYRIPLILLQYHYRPIILIRAGLRIGVNREQYKFKSMILTIHIYIIGRLRS